MGQAPRVEKSPDEPCDPALENWLRTEGVRRYDAFKRDPRAQPVEEVFAALRRHHARRVKNVLR